MAKKTQQLEQERPIERPLDFLGVSRGKRVLAELKDGSSICGRLLAFDLNLNLVLQEASEVIYPKANAIELRGKSYSMLFVKGENVKYVSPGQ